MDTDSFVKTYARHLTQQQIAAVTQVEGPSLLLAVPGSGKTTVVVLRAGYMTRCAGIPARQILTLTFSRAAAEEMRARYAALFGAQDMPRFSTIHSFCVQVLRRRRDVCMIEGPERDRLLRALYYQNSVNADAFSENAIRQIDSAIGYAKNRLLDEQGIRELASIDEAFPAVYDAYQEALREAGRMDFDDQLVVAYRLLLDDPTVLMELQETYRYVSVDEAQDTSYVQHRILYLLAQRYGNICMVGDEDQSIYGFRAAYPDVLLDYDRIYPGASILLMETNFRSTPPIVSAANALISHSAKRHSKTARAVQSGGERIRYTTLSDVSLQYAYLADSLERHAAQGKTQAVLFRNNESALPLVDLLQRRSIPFVCRDAAAAAVGGAYMQQMLALLAFALNPSDRELYQKLYHRLGLYTTRDTMQKVLERLDGIRPCLAALADVELIHNRNPRAATAAEELGKRLASLKDWKPLVAVGEAAAILQGKKQTPASAAVAPKADVLRAIAQQCDSVMDFLTRMDELSSYSANGGPCGITLSTLHSAKGLEFDRVVIIDAYEGILPARSEASSEVREKELDEELRLFYVGVTRSRRELEFITARRSFGEEVIPSRFIGWLTPSAAASKPQSGYAGDYGEFAPGARVVHLRFGEGVVSSRDEEIAAVKFDACGIKKIHLPTCCNGGILRITE